MEKFIILGFIINVIMLWTIFMIAILYPKILNLYYEVVQWFISKFLYEIKYPLYFLPNAPQLLEAEEEYSHRILGEFTVTKEILDSIELCGDKIVQYHPINEDIGKKIFGILYSEESGNKDIPRTNFYQANNFNNLPIYPICEKKDGEVFILTLPIDVQFERTDYPNHKLDILKAKRPYYILPLDNNMCRFKKIGLLWCLIQYCNRNQGWIFGIFCIISAVFGILTYFKGFNE